MFVILSPSPVILSEAKNLVPWLRASSTKGLAFWAQDKLREESH